MEWTIEKLREEASKHKSKKDFRRANARAYDLAYRMGILDEICANISNKRIYWTEKSIQEEALKYKTRGEFQKHSPAYKSARRMNLLDRVCSHMTEGRHSKYAPEELAALASKHQSRTEFKAHHPSAYKSALQLGLLDEVCSHMPKHVDQSGENHPNFRWTLETIQQEALKYKTRGEFQKNSVAYGVALKRKILEQVCSHMEEIRHYWSNEELQQEALKYKTRGEFELGSPKAYNVARIRKIVDTTCSHIEKARHLWTNEMLQKEALKYKTRGEFASAGKGAYLAAYKRGILDQICPHMPKHVDQSGENHGRFKWTLEMLQQEALKYKARGEFQNDSVAYQAALKRGLLDQICSHMPERIDMSGANSPNFKWTPEELQQEALKYKTRSEFQNNSSAYNVALRRGLLDEVCSHMGEPLNKPWTHEELQEEALKYKTRVEFQHNSPAYSVARRRNLLDEICSHMTEARHLWADEELQQEALKYKTRSDFARNSSAYNVALNRGIVDKICSHIPESSNKPWTLEELQQEALKYQTRGEFAQNSSAYGIALKRGLLDTVCSHMEETRHSWSDEEIQEEALKYKTRGEFQCNSAAYGAAQRRDLLDKVCAHMPKHVDQSGTNNPRFKWTPEELQEEALKYKTRVEFQHNSPAYSVARRRTLLDEICSHMTILGGESLSEQDLFKFIKSKYPKTTKLRDRKVNIPGKPHIKGFDVDMYIPELRKGIEFDGKYWHSVEGLKRSRDHWPEEDLENYHRLKDEHFRSKGIELLHINEKDWLKDPNECIEKCLEFLGYEF